MRHANPTSLKLGMTGSFLGQRYRIGGRVVLSMEEAGETYYWNEFHLIGDDGRCATLVFEQTEQGPEWKMFTLVEAVRPMSASEAALKSVGDQLYFQDKTLAITCVDESRVCEIEGEAPEGVELGDVAHYFNAESDDTMVVVSWTGEEVEFYRGLNIPMRAVSSAFGVPAIPAGALNHLSSANDDLGKRRIGLFALVVLVVPLVMFASMRSGCRRPEKSPKLPSAQLSLGSTGQLNALQYRITGHAVVEIARVGQRYLRHEYSAVDDAGNEVLLWQGTEQGEKHWMLARPATSSRPLPPTTAASLQLGQPVVLDGVAAHVSDFFLSRVGQVEGVVPWAGGSDLYGFAAHGAKETIIARWNGTAITFYRAAPVTQKNPAQAFR
jgi:Domain of unknown function (DUF4178)